LRIRCKFSTKPRLNLTVKRPKKYPKDYPVRPKTLGEKIRKHRMDLGLFQKDVAKFVGVATDTVRLWEKDRTKPSEMHLRKIKEFLSIKIKKFR
jgi:DNA-binding XRE family transcriptional regulator